MITLLLRLFRILPFLFGSHRHLALENLALRQQLAMYKRTVTRPPLRRSDRLFWIVGGLGIHRGARRHPRLDRRRAADKGQRKN